MVTLLTVESNRDVGASHHLECDTVLIFVKVQVLEKGAILACAVIVKSTTFWITPATFESVEVCLDLQGRPFLFLPVWVKYIVKIRRYERG